MWLLLIRQPKPDARVWAGRRWLAALDAVAWPAALVLLVRQVPASTGLLWPVSVALATVLALHRLQRAIWANPRYQFTTWRWAKAGVILLVAAEVLRLTAGR